ncbi:probable SNA2 Integral mebrane protein [Rhynchosporium agropyri]|uniref:Probable SNA2 Integral mebrane protein n=1 Tax=Rhynchosporium agropyri TaxID=914238 RepID=A0A1E1JTT8_9HELO|nr:probable SNA2 Integral mebrane protein [Rhynchosporium agropyri]
MCSSDMFLGLIAILFPPLAVWVKCGICSADSLINICLCMLGFLPGLLHAWYIIAKFSEHDYDSIPADAESGRVTYVIVDGQRRVATPSRAHGPAGGYGTTAPLAPPLHQNQNGTWNNNAAEGSSSGGAVPPSYAEAVKGDNKIQTKD